MLCWCSECIIEIASTFSSNELVGKINQVDQFNFVKWYDEFYLLKKLSQEKK